MSGKRYISANKPYLVRICEPNRITVRLLKLFLDDLSTGELKDVKTNLDDKIISVRKTASRRSMTSPHEGYLNLRFSHFCERIRKRKIVNLSQWEILSIKENKDVKL